MKVLEKTNEVILSRKEYKTLIDQIEELEDVVIYYETKNEPGTPWEEVKKELGLDVQNNNSSKS